MARSDKGGGYDFELVVSGSVADGVQCPICTLLLRDPLELPCDHSFCSTCWTSWESEKLERKQPITCPLCNTVYGENQARKSGRFHNFIRTALDVKCKQHKEGCSWTGKIDDYQYHEPTCPYIDVECQFDGCGQRFKRIHLEKHLQDCQYRHVPCEWCQAEVAILGLENHYGDCQSIPASCTNDGCDIEIEKCELIDHLENYCEYQQVPCEFASIGCKDKIARNKMDVHRSSFMPKHMSLLLTELSTVNSDAAEKEQRLKQVEERLDGFVQKEQNLQEELQLIKTDLDEKEQCLTAAIEEINSKRENENSLQKELDTVISKLQTVEKKLIVSEKKGKHFQQTLERSEQARGILTGELLTFSEKAMTINKTILLHLCQEIDTSLLIGGTFMELREMLGGDRYVESLKMKYCDVKFSLQGNEFDISELLYKTVLKNTRQVSYAEWFQHMCNSMETDRLYRINNDKELYVKIQIKGGWIHRYLYVYLVTEEKLRKTKTNPLSKYENDNVCIHVHDNAIDICLHQEGWTKGNTNGGLLHPRRNEEIGSGGLSCLFVNNFSEKLLCEGYIVIKLKKR